LLRLEHMRVLSENTVNRLTFRLSDPTSQWYVLYTKPLSEKKVAERLQLLGIAHYLPLYTTIKEWSDRKKKLEKPLINSVVFVQCSAAELQLLYTVQGFSRILHHNGKPAVVQAHEIQNLRILLQEVGVAELEPIRIEPGAAVEVTRGPFKGVIATAVQVLNSMRLLIEIKQLGIAFSVNVPKSFVKPL
jgi:transcription antitermination factor NusG